MAESTSTFIVCNVQNKGPFYKTYTDGDNTGGITIDEKNSLSVDLTSKSSILKQALDKKQNSLAAGNGIFINDNIISNKFPYKDYKDSNDKDIDLDNIPWNEYYIGSLNANLEENRYAKNLPKNSATKSGEFVCIPNVADSGLMIFSPYNKPWELWVRKYYSGKWQNWVEYAPPFGGGENVNLTNVLCSGNITSNSQQINFFINTGRLCNYSSVKIKNMRLQIRGTDGTYYFDGDQYGVKVTNDEGKSAYKYGASYSITPLGIYVSVVKYTDTSHKTKAKWNLGTTTTVVTNNTPISVRLLGNVKNSDTGAVIDATRSTLEIVA